MKKTLLSCVFAALSFSAVAEDVVVFSEDFKEWEPVVSAFKKTTNTPPTVTDNVGQNLIGSGTYYNPQMTTIKDADGNSTWFLVRQKGYEFLGKDEAQAKKSNGWGLTYLKISITTYGGGLRLPAIEALGDGLNGLKLEFDWTPFCATDSVWDPTEIVVLVENGDDVKQIPIPKAPVVDKQPYQWFHQTVDLNGYTVNKDTRIVLRNCDAQYPAFGAATDKLCARWFLNNIKLTASGGAGVADIKTDENAPVEYFNLQGVKVASPEKGVFIRRQGKNVSKIIVD